MCVASFARGVACFRVQDFAAAAHDFTTALANMRDSLVIDYRQLGFRLTSYCCSAFRCFQFILFLLLLFIYFFFVFPRFKLYKCDVLHNLGLALAKQGLATDAAAAAFAAAANPVNWVTDEQKRYAVDSLV